MTKRKLRSPKSIQGKTIKTPLAVSLENPDLQPPIFSFEHMVDGYCVKSCEQEDRAAFASSLHKRGKLSWRDLRHSGRHQLGSEKIERSSLKISLPPKITPDIDIIAFRFHGKKSMLGYKDGRIFHILLLDPKLKAYNH
ncbi:hypothetical protein KAI19_05235 [bacterium]|nr:hypothetical protein [bacterium]